jgi:hypothetical protein
MYPGVELPGGDVTAVGNYNPSAEPSNGQLVNYKAVVTNQKIKSLLD